MLPAEKVKCFKLHTKMDISMLEDLKKAAKLKNTKVSKLVRQFIENGLKEIQNEKSS
jgi:hypothetical protein